MAKALKFLQRTNLMRKTGALVTIVFLALCSKVNADDNNMPLNSDGTSACGFEPNDIFDQTDTYRCEFDQFRGEIFEHCLVGDALYQLRRTGEGSYSLAYWEDWYGDNEPTLVLENGHSTSPGAGLCSYSAYSFKHNGKLLEYGFPRCHESSRYSAPLTVASVYCYGCGLPEGGCVAASRNN